MIFILQLFITKNFNTIFGIDVSKDHLDIFDSSKKALKTNIKTVEQQIEQLEAVLNDLTDEEHQAQFDLITSVVGIGQKQLI